MLDDKLLMMLYNIFINNNRREMKRTFWFGLAVFSLVFSGVLSSAPNALAASEIDQQYTGGTGSVQLPSLSRNTQSFKPQFSKLDKVEIELAAPISTASLSCWIEQYNGTGWDLTTPCGTKTAAIGWIVFDFDDVTVDNSGGARYRIKIVATYTGQAPLWKYGIQNPSGPYANGVATWNSVEEPPQNTWDYNFKTWGYNPSTPPVDEPPAVTSETVTGSTAATETPSTTTSSSIVKPTNLTAVYSGETGKIGGKLTWAASTTTAIDGYKIFRSETKGKSYAKISQTVKGTLEYLDAAVAASKTYYYVVRAYKGSEQSANSNEASIAIPENAPPATPSNFRVDFYSDSIIRVAWDKNAESNISGYDVVIYKGDELVETKTIEPENQTAAFSNLSAETEYKVTLIAKNDQSKSSTPAELIQKTKPAEVVAKVSFRMTPLTWGLLAVAAILSGVLGFLIYRRRKSVKINNN